MLIRGHISRNTISQLTDSRMTATRRNITSAVCWLTHKTVNAVAMSSFVMTGLPPSTSVRNIPCSAYLTFVTNSSSSSSPLWSVGQGSQPFVDPCRPMCASSALVTHSPFHCHFGRLLLKSAREANSFPSIIYFIYFIYLTIYSAALLVIQTT